MATVVQILFAVAWGFLFTLFFYKSGSLWPSIIAHALINASSRYAVEEPTAHRIFIIATILTVVYGAYLWKLEEKTQPVKSTGCQRIETSDFDRIVGVYPSTGRDSPGNAASTPVDAFLVPR